ncbi:MAG: hypothetical protein ACO331_10020 [Prochlorothrix sp.]
MGKTGLRGQAPGSIAPDSPANQSRRSPPECALEERHRRSAGDRHAALG